MNHTFRDHSITVVPWKPVFFPLKGFSEYSYNTDSKYRKNVQLCPMAQSSYCSVNESYQMMNGY